MAEYLKYFPKPLLEEIIKGECLPIIGSGFSLNAIMPKGIKMPLWDELGKKFATYLPDYNYTNALDAISAYSHEYTRNNLISKLYDLLYVNVIKPGETHTTFSDLPFKIVCTTNFDFLLEDSYQICKPIIDETQLSLSSDENTTLILKIHGDLNHPTQLVATEEDYDTFIDKNPLLATYLSYLLIVKTPLFIGYSIDDPDFRQIFKIVNERLGQSRRPAYTIKINANHHEIAKYERRGVKVINIVDTKQSYSKVFPDLFRELKQYWNDNILKTSTFTQKETMIQLLNKTDSQNRLCFFSVPFSTLPLYKDLIFPLVEKYGFVPLSADEVISYGDTILAKINAMIEKSDIIICDITNNNSNVLYELNTAIGYKSKKVLIVGDENSFSTLKFKMNNAEYVTRENNLEFVERIDNWLKNLSEPLYDTFSKEPMRLFDKEEYRAAIISAFSLLEVELNSFYESRNLIYKDEKASMQKLTEKLHNLEVLSNEQMFMLRKWQRVRNELVHTKRSITKKDAKEIVYGLMDMISFIRNQKKISLTTASTL